MNKKDNLRERIDQAEQIIQLYSRLDYAAIIAHEAKAVAILKDVVNTIRGPAGKARGDSRDAAERQDSPAPVEFPDDKAALADRRRLFVEALSHGGLGPRLGKVYSTNAASRVVAFRDVPHKLGLPAFDMVVAADFSPQAGYHGIFIGAREVMSFMLLAPFERPWHLRERHAFSSNEQMVELVSLLSAGFPVV